MTERQMDQNAIGAFIQSLKSLPLSPPIMTDVIWQMGNPTDQEMPLLMTGA